LLSTMNMPIIPAMAPWMTAMMARIMRSALLEGLQRLLLADGRSGLLPAHLSVDLLGGVAVFREVACVVGRGSASEGFDLGAEMARDASVLRRSGCNGRSRPGACARLRAQRNGPSSQGLSASTPPASRCASGRAL